MGVAYDRRALTYTAVIRCEPRGFYLMSPSEREYQLACYGGLLAMFAREFSPVRRIAWYERSLPPSSNELVEHLHAARRPGIPDADPGMRAMWELLEAHGTGTVDHEVLVALQIDLKRTSRGQPRRSWVEDKAGRVRAPGRAHVAAGRPARGDGRDGGQQAGVRSPAVPSPGMLAKLLRDGIDPFSRRSRDVAPNGQEPGISVEDFGPRARTDGWGHVRTDGALHAVGRVSRWPARDVRSSFLQPLLMDTHEVTRTCAMVMEVLPPEKARRHVERRALSAEGDRAVRARFGKRESARTRLATEAIAQHELELAVGHADVSLRGLRGRERRGASRDRRARAGLQRGSVGGAWRRPAARSVLGHAGAGAHVHASAREGARMRHAVVDPRRGVVGIYPDRDSAMEACAGARRGFPDRTYEVVRATTALERELARKTRDALQAMEREPGLGMEL